ncbi:substrate-binding periplasmic protein [Rhodoferax aquaticus]|uniref:Transporter substrate-binding domain-containing protein n=1 Tax=Rhodoferax aquaticus TaxID=2527691 RepID=A0A515EK48_9BURK|nr:transporter substrate-binding domain-containing protein [Rhodoferax aquaticus]QDL52969.1 transporter substrate-binding domain-containing protein [Rhodoferax aquaticus]
MTKMLVVALAVLAAFSAYAQKITVVTEEYPPYNFQDANKKITGISTDVVEEVLKRAKLDYQLGMYPWARAYQMAQDGPNVLIYSIGRSEKRETLFKWVDVIAPYDVYLYRLKSRTNVTASDIASAKSFKIGAVREDVRAQFLEKEGIKADLVTDDSTNAKKLAAERIDLFPIDELGMVALYKREGLDPSTVVKAVKLEALSAGLYMAFSKQTPDDVVNKAKAALADMKKDGTLDKIKAKYLK